MSGREVLSMEISVCVKLWLEWRREIRGPISEFKFEINCDNVVELVSSGEFSEVAASAVIIVYTEVQHNA